MTLAGTVAGTATSFQDTGLVAYQPYFYRLTSVYSAGFESEPSLPVEGRAFRKIPPTPPVLAVPSVVAGPAVHVTWTTDEPLQVTIQRQTEGEFAWHTIADWLDAAVTSFDDTDVISGVGYSYRVRGRDAAQIQTDLSAVQTVAVP